MQGSIGTAGHANPARASADGERNWVTNLIATWAVGLVLLLLGQAVARLGPLAIEPWREDQMGFVQKAIYVAWVLFNAYAEGYRGFQLRFSPRVVARAFHLGKHPTPLRVLLALPYCMSLFAAKRRQQIVSWILLLAIIAVVALVRQAPQPWRGIIDGGVVVGLLWGMAAIVVFWLRGLAGHPPPVTDLPEQEATEGP